MLQACSKHYRPNRLGRVLFMGARGRFAFGRSRPSGPLRRLIADHYHLRVYVDMVDTPAFHSDVMAYPAIFVVGRERTGVTRFVHRPSLEKDLVHRQKVRFFSEEKPHCFALKDA